MFRIVCILNVLLLFSSMATAKNNTSLSVILTRLDSVIDVAPSYEVAKMTRIAELNKQLNGDKNPMSRYNTGMLLYEEYRAYKNDSAISILQDNLTIAKSLHRQDLANNCLSLIAFQCSTVGHYPDAEAMLEQVDVSQLKGRGAFLYYRAMNHLYGEIGFYSHIKSVKDSAYAISTKYEKLLLQSLDKNSREYKEYLCRSLYGQRKLQEALKVCNEWLEVTKEGSREFSMVAFYQYIIRVTLGDKDAVAWAARSAINDITHAVMDQGSLWEVAHLISGDDINRSYKYIKYAWQCASVFGTDIRTKQISPVLSVIGSQYQTELDRANHRLLFITVVIALLAVVLFAMLVYTVKQRKHLAIARNDLHQRNLDLAESNEKLINANEKVTLVNSQLNESNQIKEAYIGRYLALCSDYVDRMDKERKQASKLVKAHKIDELSKLLRSTEQRDKDVEELYGYFDKTFLNIFPSFVENFNALLKPEYRIDVESGKLNTTLRIFALIRLGIDDSSKIASFLHYSVNTIYNYRARTKNGCLGDRDSFEDEVKKLG